MAALSTRSAAIVQARDVGTFTTPDGQWLPYMVLEWLDGQPLDVVLEEESRRDLLPRSLHEALALLDPAAAALAIAHSYRRGACHAQSTTTWLAHAPIASIRARRRVMRTT